MLTLQSMVGMTIKIPTDVANIASYAISSEFDFGDS
jgi:hypothetical protein